MAAHRERNIRPDKQKTEKEKLKHLKTRVSGIFLFLRFGSGSGLKTWIQNQFL